MLRPAQAFGFVGAVERCNGPVRPRQPPLRGFVARPVPRRRDCQDAAFAFDHYITRVGGSWCNERQTTRGTRCHPCANQFGTGSGLTKSAAGEEKPHPPVACRRQLRRTIPERPIVEQRSSLGGA